MNKTQAIFEALNGDIAIKAKVGDRLYPIIAPKSVEAPYIVFSHIGCTPNPTHSEPSSNENDLYQFACFAPTLEEASAIRDTIIQLLDTNLRINTEDSPTLEDKRESYDEVTELFRYDADFMI